MSLPWMPSLITCGITFLFLLASALSISSLIYDFRQFWTSQSGKKKQGITSYFLRECYAYRRRRGWFPRPNLLAWLQAIEREYSVRAACRKIQRLTYPYRRAQMNPFLPYRKDREIHWLTEGTDGRDWPQHWLNHNSSCLHASIYL